MRKLKSIEIKNSPFFEDTKIEFKEKLNCVMGGRGTGKSTLLFLLKSAIFSSAEDDKSIYAILRSNLGNGEIAVEIEAEDGSAFRITKTFNDDPQPYKHPGGEFISIEKIFADIECDFYETGKIEEIGRSEKDRLVLLDKKIKSIILEIDGEIKQIQIELDANAQDIKSFNKRLERIDESLAQYENIEAEFEQQKQQQPAGLKDEEKQEFEEADTKEKYRKEEKRFFNKVIELFREVKNELESKKSELDDTYKACSEGKGQFINTEITQPAIKETEVVLNKLHKQFSEILSVISAHENLLDSQFSLLIDKHELQQAEFVKLKQKFDTYRDYINKYHLLSKRLNERDTLLKDKKELFVKRDKLKTQRISLVKRLNSLKQRIFKERLSSINELNKEFDGAIIINLTYSGITQPFEEKLKEALKGSGMRYNELIPKIIQKFTTDDFAGIIHNKDIERLKSITGIDQVRSDNIINALYETEAIYEIERMYCDDLPEFKLRIHEGELSEENYRKTEELSMGQRCTTVLPIIFAVSKNPLIIDQPEDNLDNKYISNKIHEIIRKQKEERQLIFITHNPNIPVLSESENNVFLKYDKKASVDASGNVEAVKEKIIELLEGGATAFKKRKETYGY